MLTVIGTRSIAAPCRSGSQWVQTIGFSLLMGLTPLAWANCTSSDQINYVCSGATAAGTALSNVAGSPAGNLSVTADSTFDTSASPSAYGLGLIISAGTGGGGNATLDLAQGSNIVSGVNGSGVTVVNNGTGAGNSTTITSAGNITGNGTASTTPPAYHGLYANNGTTAGLLSFEQTGGAITGSSIASGVGVYLYNQSNRGIGTTFIQDAGTIAGTAYGVYLQNQVTGAGPIAFTQDASGTISASAGAGLYLTMNSTSAAGGNTNNLVAVDGTIKGRAGLQYNTGPRLTLTQASTGSISGTTTFGIMANSYGDMNLSIAGSVTGYDAAAANAYGIGLTKNAGSSGNITVNQTAATSLISGYSGISAINLGGNDTIITTAGTVNGNGDGVATTAAGIMTTASSQSVNTSVTQTSGAITGTMDGITTDTRSASGTNTVTTSGTVKGTSTTACASTTNRDCSGINVASGASARAVKVEQKSGDIEGGNYGIYASQDGGGGITILQDSSNGSIVATATDGIYSTVTTLATGATTITTAGAVTGGSAGDGIHAVNSSPSTTTSLTITQTAGSITGSVNGIDVANNSASATPSTTVTVAAQVTGGSGAGIFTTEAAGKTVTTTLQSGAKVSATSGKAIADMDGNAAVTLQSGSTLIGAVQLGIGNDSLTIQGSADISGATTLDGGGVSINGSVTDSLAAKIATNKLTFQNTTQTTPGANLLNWQTVTLDKSTVTLSDGKLTTGAGIDPDGVTQGGLVLGLAPNISTLISSVALAVTGDVRINAQSTLRHALGGNVTGNVTNAGVIRWSGATPGVTLTVTGNYTGNTDSELDMNTTLGDSASASDVLHVTGDTAGSTGLKIANIKGKGAATTGDGILVVQVDGASNGAFTLLNAPLVAGAYEYKLYQGGPDDTAKQNWYLRSDLDCTLAPTDPACATPPPAEPVPTLGWKAMLIGMLLLTMMGTAVRRRQRR